MEIRDDALDGPPMHAELWRLLAATAQPSLRLARARRCDPEAPTGAETFPAWSLAGRRVVTVPDLWDPALEQLPRNNDVWEAYWQLEVDDSAPRHRAFGWPEPVQSEMRLVFQLASNGINVGGPEGYRDPQADALTAGASHWLLLWQIDSDEVAGWMWG